MLHVKRIHKKKGPFFFDEFTSISVNLVKSEAMEFYNLDGIQVDMFMMCLTST